MLVFIIGVFAKKIMYCNFLFSQFNQHERQSVFNSNFGCFYFSDFNQQKCQNVFSFNFCYFYFSQFLIRMSVKLFLTSNSVIINVLNLFIWLDVLQYIFIECRLLFVVFYKRGRLAFLNPICIQLFFVILVNLSGDFQMF